MSQLGKNFIASLQNSGNQRPNLLSLEQKIWGNVCYPGWETPGNGTGECCRAEIKPLSARPKVRILYLALHLGTGESGGSVSILHKWIESLRFTSIVKKINLYNENQVFSCCLLNLEYCSSTLKRLLNDFNLDMITTNLSCFSKGRSLIPKIGTYLYKIV